MSTAVAARSRPARQGGRAVDGHGCLRRKGRRSRTCSRLLSPSGPTSCWLPTLEDVARAVEARRLADSRRPAPACPRQRVAADGRRASLGGGAARTPSARSSKATCGRTAFACERVRVPLGVVGIIYENRPNVTADAAGCASSRATRRCSGAPPGLSSRTGSSPRRCETRSARPACPPTRSFSSRTRRTTTAEAFVRLRGFIDCLIPRGGPALLSMILEHATVPYVLDGDGNCHVYVDADGGSRHGRAHRRQREDAAAERLQRRRDAARARRRGRASSCRGSARRWRASSSQPTSGPGRSCCPVREPATEADFATEFLALELAVGVVDDLDAAISHIARYGSGHSEAIVTVGPLVRQRASSARSMRPPWSSTPRRGSSTAASSGSAPRSASRPRSCTPAARWDFAS